MDSGNSDLPRVIYPDYVLWTEIAQDEFDALELGWRVTNALIADNDPNPSIGFPVLLEIAYILDAQRHGW